MTTEIQWEKLEHKLLGYDFRTIENRSIIDIFTKRYEDFHEYYYQILKHNFDCDISYFSCGENGMLRMLKIIHLAPRVEYAMKNNLNIDRLGDEVISQAEEFIGRFIEQYIEFTEDSTVKEFLDVLGEFKDGIEDINTLLELSLYHNRKYDRYNDNRAIMYDGRNISMYYNFKQKIFEKLKLIYDTLNIENMPNKILTNILDVQSEMEKLLCFGRIESVNDVGYIKR